MSSESSQVRLYGGWRKSRSIGLGNLTPTQTAIVLVAVVGVITAAAISFRLVLFAAPAAAVVIAITMARWNGVPLVDAVVHSSRWRAGRRAGQTTYISGVTTLHEPDNDLPGVLAPVVPLSAEDGEGGHYGMAWHRRTGHLTATIQVAPTSTALANRENVDVWVSQWGAWLARLGHTPLVAHVAVTVDTAPDPGSTLEDYVSRRIDPNAPAPARELMADLVQISPAASAAVDTRVSITFDPAKAPQKPETFADAVAECGRVLRGLQASLGSCGVSVLGRASAAQLAGIVRTAYDPAARGEVARTLANNPAALLESGAMPPIDAREHFDHYEHDTGISVSWIWANPPRQFVTSDVLAPLLGPGRHPKRVTLFYEPFPAEAAADKLENEVNAAAYRAAVRARTKRSETAQDAADRERAMQAAREEAQGAGLGLSSMVVTTTVTAAKDLDRAVSDIEQRAGSSKIKLRRAVRAQSAAFAATLPLGIYLPEIARRRSR
ncbi:SCO6880 family protein [Streptomyces sp. NPDC001492]